MDNTYWHKQAADQPLFGDIIWNKPEQRALAGKLAVIGGNAHGFSAVFQAVATSQKAGIGTQRIVVPDILKRTLFKLWPEVEYAPSNKSGGFAVRALPNWLELANWSDGVMIAGDLGRNSETDMLLERFLEEYHGILTLAGDSVILIQNTPQTSMANAQILIAADLPRLQHLLTAVRYPTAIRLEMPLTQLVDLLHGFSLAYPFSLITQQDGQIILARHGQISTTPMKSASLMQAAAAATVWRLQQPHQDFAAMTSAVFTLNETD